MNLTLPPELNSALNEFYSGPRPDDAFTARLEVQLYQRQIELVAPKQKPRFSFTDSSRSFTHTLLARPLLALLAAILALAALTGVVYAIGRLTGFIPGFGFTSNTSVVYILSEPVETKQGEVTLRLDKAVSDDNRFWAALTINGLSGGETNSQVFALLPDGKKIPFQMGGRSNTENGEAQISVTFTALPPSTQSLTILIENLGGQNFKLALRLRPARPGEIIPAMPTQSAQPQSENRNGIRLVLDNVALASDKTIFQVSLHYDQPNTWVSGPWSIALSDKDGRVYPLKDITTETMNSGDTHIFQTLPFTGAEHLTLSLVVFPVPDVLSMFEDFSAEKVGFTFDPGSNPQPSQTWALNETIDVGQFKFHIVRAALTSEPGLVFEFEPVDNVTSVMLYAADPLFHGATGSPVKNQNFTASMSFEKIPKQSFKVVISQVHYMVKGPWKIQWQPPVAPTAEVKRLTPTATATPAPLATQTLAESDPILLEVQQLAQKFDAPFQQGPGWVHVVYETSNTSQVGQMYPYIKSEQWYEIDAGGYVTRNVWLDYNNTGQLVQQTATVGNYTINFSTGDSGFNNGAHYRVSLDMLTQELISAAKYHTRVIREQTTCDNGNLCLLITSMETLTEPVKNPGETQAFSGSGRRVWIDMQTGQQVKSQSFWQFPDGSQSIFSTKSTLLVEKKGSPPQDILDILSRVIVP